MVRRAESTESYRRQGNLHVQKFGAGGSSAYSKKKEKYTIVEKVAVSSIVER